MGETNETTQNTDQIKVGQATPQAKESTASGSKAETTSEKEPETLTREQANKEISDKLAAAGRDAKSLDERGKALNAQAEALKAEQAKITQWQKERDDAELESLRDDPEGLKLYQKEQALKAKTQQLGTERTAFEKDKLEHKAKIEAAEETEREIAIWEIAKEDGTDPTALKELNLDIEQTKLMSKAIKAGKAEPKPTLTPDSGKTNGGGEDLSGMSSRQAFRSHLDDKK